MAIIVATSVFQAPTVYTFAGTDVMIVGRGIGITSTENRTVVVTGVGNTILHAGLIRSDVNDAMALLGDGNIVNNTGVITSGDDGVYVAGVNSIRINSCAISGRWGRYFYDIGSDNTGTGQVLNTGTISSDNDGITSTLDQDIRIINSGLIIGAMDRGAQSTGANGSLSRISSGRIIGDMRMDAGDDSGGRFIMRNDNQNSRQLISSSRARRTRHCGMKAIGRARAGAHCCLICRRGRNDGKRYRHFADML